MQEKPTHTQTQISQSVHCTGSFLSPGGVLCLFIDRDFSYGERQVYTALRTTTQDHIYFIINKSMHAYTSD